MQDDELITAFVEALWLEENLATNSRSAYRRDLELAAKQLSGGKALDESAALATADGESLNRLLGERLSEGAAP